VAIFIILFHTVLTTALQSVPKTQKPYTLAGFEPGIFRSGGWSDNYYAMLPEACF
jgi:hypothetical protein